MTTRDFPFAAGRELLAEEPHLVRRPGKPMDTKDRAVIAGEEERIAEHVAR